MGTVANGYGALWVQCPAATGYRTEQHRQPIGNNKYEQGKYKKDSDWPKKSRNVN
jgi:hypothetical protein